jgi:hypothetical protein
MVKGLWKLAYAVVALSVCGVGLLAPGCSSDDSASGGDGSASTGNPDSGLCVLNDSVRNGAPCFPVGPTLCFQECATGGCVCTKDKDHPGADAGIWVCQSDNSCLPDSSPIDFDGPILPPFDAGDLDAGLGDSGDASDAGDADAG